MAARPSLAAPPHWQTLYHRTTLFQARSTLNSRPVRYIQTDNKRYLIIVLELLLVLLCARVHSSRHRLNKTREMLRARRDWSEFHLAAKHLTQAERCIEDGKTRDGSNLIPREGSYAWLPGAYLSTTSQYWVFDKKHSFHTKKSLKPLI